ncbi:MAG TPA: hypothetical protein VNT79_00655 [Phycisphaerae bacterium]|nr:hypothetical protein [Phycisphaerae bacterium]
MAMESTCKLQVGRDRFEGQVRMEADHIDFAGATKYRFRIAELTNPRQSAETVQFNFHGNPVSMKLSSLRVAEQWIQCMLHPRSLADKMGVASGHVVRVLNLDDGELNTSLAAKKIRLLDNGDGCCNVVMLGVDRPAELRQLGGLVEDLHADGAIWVILPKSARNISKANVFAAAKDAGMKNVEVIDFSDNRAAYKMVRVAPPRKSGPSARPVPVRA